MVGNQADWLRQNMEASHATQREVAVLLDVDPSAISRLLAGKRRLRRREEAVLRDHFRRVLVNEPTAHPPADFLRRAMNVTGIDPESLAELSGLSEHRIGELEVAAGEPPTEAELSALLPILDIEGPRRRGPVADPARALAALNRKMTSGEPIFAARVSAVAEELPLIPIYAAPDRVGDEFHCDFEIVEWRAPPPSLATASEAFGIYLPSGFGPRFQPGDLAFVHPKRPVRSLDSVLVRYDGGRVGFGLLLRQSARQITLSVDDRPVAYPLSDGVGQAKLLKVVGIWLE